LNFVRHRGMFGTLGRLDTSATNLTSRLGIEDSAKSGEPRRLECKVLKNLITQLICYPNLISELSCYAKHAVDDNFVTL
jgi:hypothetical protein